MLKVLVLYSELKLAVLYENDAGSVCYVAQTICHVLSIADIPWHNLRYQQLQNIQKMNKNFS